MADMIGFFISFLCALTKKEQKFVFLVISYKYIYLYSS